MIVLAVIFAGGRGTRLGGVDKARVTLDGKSLLRHVTDRLAAQTDHIVINSNSAPEYFDHPVVADNPASKLDGPFRALETALSVFAADKRATHLLHVPTDVPFLPPDLLRRLSGMNAPAAFPRTGARTHPVICLWTRAGALAAEVRLAHYSGERLDSFIQACGGLPAVFDAGADAFLNINTPADLDAAKAHLASK